MLYGLRRDIIILLDLGRGIKQKPLAQVLNHQTPPKIDGHRCQERQTDDRRHRYELEPLVKARVGLAGGEDGDAADYGQTGAQRLVLSQAFPKRPSLD